MKKTFIFFAILLFVLVGCNGKITESEGELLQDMEATEADDSQPMINHITNYDFSSGTTDGWGIYQELGTGEISVVDEALEVNVIDSGALNYSVQLYQDGFSLEQGCIYELTFDGRATIDRSFELRLQLNGGDYHAYTSEIYDLTADMATYTLAFDMTEVTDLAPRLAINFGTPKESEALEGHQIYLDNFSLVLVDDSNKVETELDEGLMQININQLGYKPDYIKVAIFRGEEIDETFEVVNVSTNEVVYKGNIENEFNNNTADEINYYGDFSEVTEEGTYVIRTANLGESYSFEISERVYDDAYMDTIKMLYLQRCGCALTVDLAGEYAHGICHNEEGLIYGSDTSIDVSGGWHDAGDYGRYVVPGAKAVADLFITYGSEPTNFGDDSGIPESLNGVPDILDEARYELEWMLKMQDIDSGGVYHKVTCQNFPGTVMPEDESDTLVISPISDAATGDFAAVMAMSYGLYKTIDIEFANQCLEASINAWQYLNHKSNLEGFTNPQGIVTGEYGDTVIDDEFFWASVELYKATGDDDYHNQIKAIFDNVSLGLGWADVGGYGVYAYLTLDDEMIDVELYERMRASFIAKADSIIELSNNDGYFISLEDNYPWGSNMSVANNAMFLLMADSISEKAANVEVARDHLHYLFGANPMSICYLTGYGTVSPVDTHHRPSMVIGETMPGMLVGGPNSNLQDPYAQAVLADAPPAKCYVDNYQSYSCNEVTIYWNSPLIYLMTNIE